MITFNNQRGIQWGDYRVSAPPWIIEICDFQGVIQPQRGPPLPERKIPEYTPGLNYEFFKIQGWVKM